MQPVNSNMSIQPLDEPVDITPDVFGKVAVIMGGLGAEREVSLMSGQAVLAALQSFGIDAFAIDLVDQPIKTLTAVEFDRAFNVVHGTFGEDGQLQALLKILNKPLTGSGFAASALTMNKVQTKRIWQAMGIPTPDFEIVEPQHSFQALADSLGTPFCIKPSCEGSSMGVTQVIDEVSFNEAMIRASEFTKHIMAEPWVAGDEITVGILANQVLPVIRIVSHSDFYDYEAKYFSDETEFHLPSGLQPAQEQAFQELCLQAFQAVGGEYWGRVDGFLTQSGQFQLLEVNTIPGLTSHSLVPQAAAAMGINFEQLCYRILLQTLISHEN